MPAPSLLTMAQHAAIRNVGSITDFSDLPYHAVEPILRRIDNPQQLREVEVNCPHIAESSGPLWQEFIKRDVSNAEKKMLYPKDPKSWWKVHKKMLKQEQAEKADAEEGLRRAMMGIQEAKGTNETKIVDKVISHGQKKKSGFFDGVINSGGSRSAGPLPWNAKTGKDAFGAMQRATASKQSVFKPTTRHTIPDPKSQIKVAPRSMTMEYSNPGNDAVKKAAAEAKKYAESGCQRQRVFAPKSALSKTEMAFRTEEMKLQLERERRLRSLTNSGAKAPTHTTQQKVTVPRTSASASQRTSAPPARANREVEFSPSPPRTSQQAKQPTEQKQAAAPATIKRKRPVADPFLSAKRSRP